MKSQALTFLVCPYCKREFTLSVHREQGTEIESGLLTCRSCARTYPVVRGVPRFVDGAEYASSFGFQSRACRTTQLDSQNGTDASRRALRETTGWSAADYHGQLVLDAGVGSGRFAEVVADAGGEVVGVDLTAAVDAAYAAIGRRERVHLVQADVFSMPFRDGLFDKAFSVGTLHHTPDPEAAFGRLIAAVRPGGGIAIQVHGRYDPHHHVVDRLRIVTTRLPLRLMLAASTIAVPLYYVNRIPVVGGLLRIALPVSMHHDWRCRWLDTFEWYTPKYQFKYLYPDVFRWFRDHGLEQIEVLDGPISMRAHKPHESVAEDSATTRIAV